MKDEKQEVISKICSGPNMCGIETVWPLLSKARLYLHGCIIIGSPHCSSVVARNDVAHG